jgi:hypothetical protein
MTYNAEQITFMLAEVIDENREYKSWHVNTQHLMALVERVVAEEREACADIAENWNSNGMPRTGVANEIRARGQA